METFILNKETTILTMQSFTKPIKHAIQMLSRDMEKVFGQKPHINPTHRSAYAIQLVIDETFRPESPESFSLTFSKTEQQMNMNITGNDELGLIYGILHISTVYLNIDPFWFWADIPIEPKQSVAIPSITYVSPKPTVRFRGWFVNDEVCLIGWKKPYPPTKEIWMPVFETLLRCGGNMVIPGTDLPKEGIHFELASEMGLWITHHHAEPLGAEMFLRAFPGKQASYTKHPDLYEQLWEQAIKEQKDKKVVWVLSFRGQGDQPFWAQDPSYDTDEKRGKLISQVIHRQYEMLQEYVNNPVASIALYGEISELYKRGFIDVPNDVIKIWADNGYGKMVSRRNGNENYRMPAMPEKTDPNEQGVYYHITFHDLQASNHLTMFPNTPTLIKDELVAAINAGGDDYLLLNSGNIRMHLYPLDIVAEIWKHGQIDLTKHVKQFIKRLYKSHHNELIEVYQAYFKRTIQYGKHEDDHAGEEFYHHPARQIVSHWLQGKNNEVCEELRWATPDANTFLEQVNHFKQLFSQNIAQWENLHKQCCQLIDQLGAEDRIRFYDQFVIQVALHYSGCKGFISLCEAYIATEQEHYPLAFVHASQAIWDYQIGLTAMRRSEHGKWKNFYRADWLTNVQWTIESLITLRKFLRMHGDSPDFFLWYKEYIMPETEKYIYLENTHRNPLSDDDLAKKLQAKLLPNKK